MRTLASCCGEFLIGCEMCEFMLPRQGFWLLVRYADAVLPLWESRRGGLRGGVSMLLGWRLYVESTPCMRTVVSSFDIKY